MDTMINVGMSSDDAALILLFATQAINKYING